MYLLVLLYGFRFPELDTLIIQSATHKTIKRMLLVFFPKPNPSECLGRQVRGCGDL